jgi:hypothetical protein
VIGHGHLNVKLSLKSTIINIVSAIWFARNNARFNNKTTYWKSAVKWIQVNVTMAGNRSKGCAYSSISNFSILKKFNVTIHPSKAPDIKGVIWHSPISL